MFKAIFTHLENRGFSVYAAGQHTGLCHGPYVVFRLAGEEPFLTGLVTMRLQFMVYYPMAHFSELPAYVESLQDALGDLAALKDTHSQTPAVIDPSVKAYTITLTYEVYKKRRDVS